MRIDIFEKDDAVVEYDGVAVHRGKVVDVQKGNRVYVQWKPYAENKVTIENITPIYQGYDEHENEHEHNENGDNEAKIPDKTNKLEKVPKSNALKKKPSAKLIKTLKFNF
jgi:hypothetical protein